MKEGRLLINRQLFFRQKKLLFEGMPHGPYNLLFYFQPKLEKQRIYPEFSFVYPEFSCLACFLTPHNGVQRKSHSDPITYN